MSLEDEVMGLKGEVAALRSLLSQSDHDNWRNLEQFKAFEFNKVQRDIKALQEMLGIFPNPDGEDVADPLEPVLNEESNASFSGTAYVSGRRIDGLKDTPSKPWVKVDVSDGTATEQDGPPSSPFPPSEEWFEKSNTVGDIHVTRL